MFSHFTFLEQDRNIETAIQAQYDMGLASLSVLLAIFSSYVAFLVSRHIRSHKQHRYNLLWLWAGALALGSGIWAMHFIGMLAYTLPVDINYDVRNTIISVIPAILSSFIILKTSHEKNITTRSIFKRSVLMGSGIGLMHYIGMTAMHMNAVMRYDLWLFIFSIFIAIVLAGISLQFKLQADRQATGNALFSFKLFIPAVIMGSAISAMHYTGMSAMYVFTNSAHHVQRSTWSTDDLAKVISVITLLLGVLLLVAIELSKRFDLYRKMRGSEVELAIKLNSIGDTVVIIRIIVMIIVAIFVWEFVLDPIFYRSVSQLNPRLETGLKIQTIIETSIFSAITGFFVYIVTNRLTASRMWQTRNTLSLIENANAPIFGVNAEGDTNEWNLTMERITGYQKSEVMGRSLINEFVSDDYKESIKEGLKQAMAGNETVNYEFPIYAKNSNRVDILMNWTTRCDAAGNIIGVIGVGQDITELKISQQQLIQASKLSSLGEMATSVAHELNQPLNTIRMAVSNIADMIKFEKVTTDYLLKKLQRIENQVERASSIINHMRMFGRIADEDPESLDLQKVIQSVLELMGEQLRLAGIEVTIDCEQPCPVIAGNQIQLEQVFLNLLTNARHAIEQNRENNARKIFIQGKVTDNDHLQISITDTGGGISENVLPHIFEPFFTTKEIGKGTGLGLSVSYGIVRDMDGTISAENVDGGARFIISLPLIEADKCCELL